MLDQLPILPIPQWLMDIAPGTIENRPFPVLEVLKDSLYYPSSGLDGDPVRYLAGNILSFIYVDYGYSREELNEALHNPWFHGYELVASRQVDKEELIPRGWIPEPPTPSDGDPTQYKDHIVEPYCSWSIFQRGADIPESHGPTRFSLLYLSADGVAAFQALYHSNEIAPKAVAIIQPGHAFGYNWTDFTQPQLIFGRNVMKNSHGQPQILLYGGIDTNAYNEPCWPYYRHFICFLDKADGGRIGVWANNARQTVSCT